MEGENYIADKVKVVVNKKGEVVVISTSLTVFRAEKDDTFTVDSLELSQNQEEAKDYSSYPHQPPPPESIPPHLAQK